MPWVSASFYFKEANINNQNFSAAGGNH